LSGPSDRDRGAGDRAGVPDGLAIFVAALVVRLLHLLQIRGNPFYASPVVDAQTYHERALEIAAGVLVVGEPFWQPPLYPYLLGAVYSAFGADPTLVRMLQAALGATTCALTYDLGRRIGGRTTGWIAGGLLVAYGPLLFFEGELLPPVVALPLNLGALLLLMKADAGLWRRACAGLLMGLSVIAVPTVAAFALVAPVLAEWSDRSLKGKGHGSGIRDHAVGWLPYVAALVLPIAPVFGHNLLSGGEPVAISTNGGINFYLGNNPDYDRTVGVRPGLEWEKLAREAERAAPQSASARSRYWFARGLEFAAQEPVAWMALNVKKTLLLVGRHEIVRNLDYTFFKRFAPVLRIPLPDFGWLFPLAALGILAAWRDRRRLALVLGFVGLYGAGVLLFFVTARYRLPLVPLCAVFAGLGVTACVRWARAQSWRSLTCGIGVVVAAAALCWSDPFDVAHTDESDGYLLVGQAHANAGELADAVRAFHESLEHDPDNVDAHFHLGRAYQVGGQLPSAVPHYQRVLQDYPADRETLNNLGVCQLVMGDRAGGIRTLERVRELYPGTVEIYFNLAQAYLEEGQVEKAAEVVGAGLEVDPGNELLQRLRGEGGGKGDVRN